MSPGNKGIVLHMDLHKLEQDKKGHILKILERSPFSALTEKTASHLFLPLT